MPKELLVDPAVSRQSGRLDGVAIPVHAYATPIAEEVAARGAPALVEALRHMLVIREFEGMLGRLQGAGRLSRDRLHLQGTRAPLHRAGGGGGRARRWRSIPQTTSSARTGATASSSPRALPPSRGCRNDSSPASLPPMTAAVSSTRSRRLPERGQGARRRLPALRLPRRDLHEGERLQRRHGRVDARLLPALRLLSEQRHRRRLGRDRHWCGAAQSAGR